MRPQPTDLVDYHCHLDLYPDFEKQFEACKQLEIVTLAVTTTPRAWLRNKELAQNDSHVRVALGLHPQLVAEFGSDLSLFEKYLPETRFVGEVGLDAGPSHYKSYPDQKRIFERILRACSEAKGKILSVHSVRSSRDVLKAVETYFKPESGTVVLHWFTGSKAEAKRAVELGCYFSVNSEMLKREPTRSLVSSLPHDRVITETDGPFTMVSGRATLPSDVECTVSMLANLWLEGTAETKECIRTNVLRLEQTLQLG